MTRNSFLILLGATVLSVLAALAVLTFDRGGAAMAMSGERLLPDLDSKASDIARVVLRDDDEEMVIERRDGAYVDAASGYPVDTGVLQDLVGALALAEIAEAKTTDPARHAELGLAAPDAEEGAGREIVLEDADDGVIAHVIAGDRDYTLGGLTGGQFVRRGDEDATWLVRARINPPSRRAGWFDSDLFTGEESDVLRATLTPREGDPVTFAREDEAFVLTGDLPEGKVARESNINRIPRFLAALDFDDVRKAGEVREQGATLTAELADDLTVDLTELVDSDGDGDDNTWVRIDVQGSGEDAEALRDRVDGFEFALQSYDAQIFGWTFDDLIENAES